MLKIVKYLRKSSGISKNFFYFMDSKILMNIYSLQEFIA